MKTVIVGFVCILTALFGIALVNQLFAQPPGFVVPAPDSDPALAALTGSWDATRPGMITRIAVERVRPKWASVIVFWSDASAGAPGNNGQRIKARVLDDGVLQWGYPTLYTLRIHEGSATLTLEKEVLGEFRYATFAEIAFNKSGEYAMATGR